MSRVNTDGCSELTCPYHGPENMRKLAELEASEWPGMWECADVLDGATDMDGLR